ncbi:alpha/beta hydrolase [Wenzhouxiangella sp. AB-CW3]|uniref:alpha/beta hydrolase n=1 Tax=Wenzhouxiangella sp. AB-CW3 TaxID=2771012 RepID=UPI00168ABA42|nr:alpha/beta hydrolase [Wenzhouxiangella sp. AB-CW3]QOC21952.1 alpha/beta hydrolase [Wenzhouxiangella sp. AB-CW3]
MLRFLLMLALAYGALLLLLYLFQPRLLFLPGVPGRDLVATPEHIGLEYRELNFETADGETLHGWWLPHADARATLLFHHGNAGNISHRLDSLQIFHDLGLEVLIFDYRGYGQSTGSPSEAGLYEDARAAWRWLLEEQGAEADQVILFGRSMGGAVAARLASEVEAAGLITESTFTSVPDIGAELYWWLPVRLLARLDFNAREAVAEAAMPVLVVHSPDDEIIPFEHGQRLYEAAGERGTLLEIRGDHNTGFLASGDTYRDGLNRFISELDQ